MTTAVDTIAFFDGLADEMNAHPDRFTGLGDAEMTVGIVMRRPNGDFRLRLDFAGLGCSGVVEVQSDEALLADFCLVGPFEAWRAMFDDIHANGRATGLSTINSLALMGDRIHCDGQDPMGLDKFSRFNQTLQEFLDGARHLAVSTR